MVLMMLRCARLVSAAASSHSSCSYVGDLLPEELRLIRLRDMPMRSNELCVTMMPSHSPLAILRGQELAALAGEVLLAGDEQPGIGVELHELAAELLQQVIGHDVQRLLDEPRLLHLHAGGGHGEGLAGADGMGQERIAAAHDAPDGVFLVRPQRDVRIHAGKVEVGAIEEAQAEVVVGVVVEAHQAFRALGIGEEPGRESAP